MNQEREKKKKKLKYIWNFLRKHLALRESQGKNYVFEWEYKKNTTFFLSDTGNNEVEFRFDDFLKRYDFHVYCIEMYIYNIPVYILYTVYCICVYVSCYDPIVLAEYTLTRTCTPSFYSIIPFIYIYIHYYYASTILRRLWWNFWATIQICIVVVHKTHFCYWFYYFIIFYAWYIQLRVCALRTNVYSKSTHTQTNSKAFVS